MEHNEKLLTIDKIISSVSELVPVFLSDPIDNNISKGDCALCIIDENGQVYGKIFGTDKIRGREFFRVAWTKASQVWITGYNTNEFETLVFNKKIDHRKFGINMPDYVGWEGGQPVTLADGTKLSVGFSGFRGMNDLKIVKDAIDKL